MKLKDNRSFIGVLLLTFITFGIYGIYYFHVVARDTNVACQGDGKKTRGVIMYFIFSLLTLGIYPIIYPIMLISRWENYVNRKGEKPNFSLINILLWQYVGVIIVIGPVVAAYKQLKAFNQVCHTYNTK